MDHNCTARWLRATASATILGGCVLLAVLWLLNFWRADVVWAPIPGQGQVVAASYRGQLEIVVHINSPSLPRWGAQSYSVTCDHWRDIALPLTNPVCFGRLGNSRGIYMSAPYWFLVPAAGILAAAPWTRWSTRFSLRAMLVATALVAIALWIFVRSSW